MREGRGRTPAALLVGLLLPAVPAAPGELRASAVLTARGLSVESPPAWIDGGFGRLTEGASGAASDGARRTARAEAHLGLEWTPSELVLVRLHGTARTEPGAAGGYRAGLTEAFLQYRPEPAPGVALRARAGLMFLPTSRENVDPLWQSPYALTLSALNTWIGEELRPVGLDAALLLGTPGSSRWELGGALLTGCDTAGALVAWRGWGLSNRLSVAREVLPLPPLDTLGPGGAFADQRDDGTRPVDELDGRPGWHVRGRWSRDGLGLLQAAWTDTRGDRALHRGQYAWETRFVSLGAEARLGRALLVSEWMLGRTGMGPGVPGGPFVEVRFGVGYALATWAEGGGRVRLTGRYDRFRNEDRDRTAEPGDESGWAVTVAGLFAPRPWLRLGIEYVELRADRPAAVLAGAPVDTDARRAQAELRLRF